MKIKFTILSLFLSALTWAQGDIKVSEENHSFSNGSKNALVVNIPYGNKDLVEKELKKELKNWNGKYDSKGEELSITQAVSKFMGDKPFDTYAKVISSQNNEIKVAFATDLGGAYLSSREHSQLFKAMSDKIKDFAKETAAACVAEELDKNRDALSDLEKTQRSLEKDKKGLEEDIEDYKKKIAEAEEKIKQNVQNQENQKEAIKNQSGKVTDVENRLKTIK
jgi:chromosome segregation ATPase